MERKKILKQIALAVVGATGRMGKRLIRAIHSMEGVSLAGALVSPHSPFIGKDSGEEAGIQCLGVSLTSDPLIAFKNVDGILDFSTPSCAVHISSVAARLGIFDVVGVSGLTEDDEKNIQQEAKDTVIVRCHNGSMLMNLLSFFVEKTASILKKDDFDIEILEMHHRDKIDSPSGSSLMLAQSAAKGRGVDLFDHQIRTRDGFIGPRPEGGIGFAVLRGGSIAGDHSVIFAGGKDRLVLSHHTQNPELFAEGALQAACWAYHQKPGFYSMRDVFGFDTKERKN